MAYSNPRSYADSIDISRSFPTPQGGGTEQVKNIINSIAENYSNSNPVHLSDPMLPTGEFLAKPELVDTWHNFDYLGNRYPRYKEHFQLMRNQGFTNEQIETFMINEFEPTINFFASEQQVNDFFMRTPETIKLDADYMRARQFKAYKSAFPDKSDDDIFNAIGVSEAGGINTVNLLKYPDMYKDFTDEIMRRTGATKVREGTLDATTRGFKNYLTQRDIASVGMDYLRGTISREDAYAKEQELSANYIPDPLVPTKWTDFVSGTSKLLTQTYYTAGKAGLAGLAVGTMGEGIGRLIGAAPMAGFAMGSKYASMFTAAGELLALQAGQDMLTISKLKDNNGEYINENAARTASLITGAITVATEMYGMTSIMRSMGLGSIANIIENGGKNAVIQAVQHNPILRERLGNLAIDAVKGIGWGTINNIIESIGGDLGPEIAKGVADAKYLVLDAVTMNPMQYTDRHFNPTDWEQKGSEIWQHVKDATTTSIRDFSGAALVGLAIRIPGILKANRDYYKSINKLVQNINSSLPEEQHLTIQDIEKAVYSARTANTPTEQLTQPEFESTPDIIQPVQKEEPQFSTEIEQPNTQEVIQDTQSQPKVDYYYLPVEALEKTGLTPAFIVDNEGAITPEQFNQLKQDNPDIIKEFRSFIREGTEGSTLDEAQTKIELTDKAKAEFYHSQENQQTIQNVTQQFENAGENHDDALLMGEIVGAINASVHARYGVDLTPITVQNVTQEAEAQTQTQELSRLSPEYDINNPDTWPDKERAEQASKLRDFSNVTPIMQTVKKVTEWFKGDKPQKAENIEKKTREIVRDINSEAPDKVKSSLRQVGRAELKDFTEELSTAANDIIDTFSTRSDLDTSKYETNSTFPKGKKKHPDAAFVYDFYDGITKVNIAVDNEDLKVQIYYSATKNSTIFSIKNFKNAPLDTVLQDLTAGRSERGLLISEVKTGQELTDALSQFWNNNNLPIHEDLQTQQAVDTITPAIEHNAQDMSTLDDTATDTSTEFQEIQNTTDNTAPEIDNEILPEEYVDTDTQDTDESIMDYQTQSVLKDIMRTDDITTRKNLLTWLNADQLIQLVDFSDADIDETFSLQDIRNVVLDALNNIYPIAQSTETLTDTNTSQQDIQPIPDLDRKLMPQQARHNLAVDEANSRTAILEASLDDSVTTRSKKNIHVMRTPLVMTLVGAKHFPINITNGKIKLILRDNPNIAPGNIMDLAPAITDPIAIFQAKSEGEHQAISILTNLKDDNGADIITTINLDYKGDINKINNVEAANLDKLGSLLYINTDKANAWQQSSGVNLLNNVDDITGIKTQQDLYNIWQAHNNEGFYFTNPYTGQHQAFTSFKYGRALVNIIQSGNFAKNVHELGHITFDFMAALANQGVLQMQQDLKTILDHAGVSLEEFNAEKRNQKNGAVEKVQEYFAKAFELYLSEGKAPNTKLQKAFDRIRKFLLDFYTDIQTQLGVQIDDDVRAVFDRLLTMPNDPDTNVGDIVLNDIQITNQINEYNNQLGILQSKYSAEQLNDTETLTPQVTPDALAIVEEYSDNLDLHDIQQEELDAMQGYNQDLLNAIKEAGLISMQDIAHYAGNAQAEETIWRNWKRRKVLSSKGGLMLDEAASIITNLLRGGDLHAESQAHITPDDIINFLSTVSPETLTKKIPDVKPTVPINRDTINAFILQRGIDGTVDYLHDRLKFIAGDKSLADEQKEINAWISVLQPMTGEYDNSPSVKPKKIYKRDLKKAANTGYQLGLQQGKIEQNATAQLAQLWRSRAEARYKEALKTQKLDAQKKAEIMSQEFKADKEADKVKAQERLERTIQRINERNQKKQERALAQFQRREASLLQRIQDLRNYQRNTSEQKNINRLVKSITRMATRPKINVMRHLEIQKILEDYNLKNYGRKKGKSIRSILTNEELIKDTEATTEALLQEGISMLDVENILTKINVDTMTLQEIRDLHSKIKAIYNLGRREYELWLQQKKQRRLHLLQMMAQDIIKNTKAPEKRVITDRDDLHKKRLGVSELAHNYWEDVQTPGRFLEGLGENFRRVLDDGFTQRRGEAFRWIHMRENNILSKLKDLGLKPTDLAENAITLDGRTYSWNEVISIYNFMKNDKSALAVIWGNFVNNNVNRDKIYDTYQQGVDAINQILALVNHPDNDKFKQFANLLLQELDEHYPRIKEAYERDFNRTMSKEENYSRMFRLMHNSAQGFVDSGLEELGDKGLYPQLLHKVSDNFTISRQNINPMNQAPIRLNAWANWLDTITEQEFSAALGGYASDVISALLLNGENGSIKNMIQGRLGDNTWNYLRSIFNDSINDRMLQEQIAADKIASFLVRNRSIAYVAYRLPTMIAQFSSFFSAAPYSSWGHLFRSLSNFMEHHNDFLENVFDKVPELRYSGGDVIDKAFNSNQWIHQRQIKNDNLRKGLNAYKSFIELGYKGVQTVDNWTKAIVFDAVYNSELENGNSEQDAIRLAYRAVQDTQPASSPREMTRLNRNAKGVTRLAFTQFMGALAPLFNMAFVDVARNIAHPSWNSVKAAANKLLAVSISIAFASFIKGIANGKLPSYEENPDGSIDDLSAWALASQLDGYISTIPVFNRLYDGATSVLNHKYYRGNDRFTQPVIDIAQGTDYLFNDKYEGLYNDKAIGLITEGLTLMGVPIPYAGLKDIFRWFDFNK